MKLTARGRRKLAETMQGIAGTLTIACVVCFLIAIPLPLLALLGAVTAAAIVAAAKFTWEVFTHKVTTRYKRRRWIRRG